MFIRQVLVAQSNDSRFLDGGPEFGYHYANPPCCFDSRAKDRLRAVLHFMCPANNRTPQSWMRRMRTNVYIDGFNFYYGCYKHNPSNQPYKWLDFRALCESLLPADEIHRVHYFTAMVSEVPWSPGAPIRQETYIRALRTRPKLYVHLGKFQPITRTGSPTGTPPGVVVPPVSIDTYEEKGSDVNLATRLLMDAVEGDFEQALVISNDSDLTEPVRLIKHRFHLPIVVISPYSTLTSKLRRASTSWGILDSSMLPHAQLPKSLKDKKGRLIVKPSSW